MGETGRLHKPVDLLEFKRRLQARVESGRSSDEDPLAELARIIGGNGRIITAEDEPREAAPGGGGYAEGQAQPAPASDIEPVRHAAQSHPSDFSALDPPVDPAAGLRDGSEADWHNLDAPVLHANEDLPVAQERAYLRLRNRKRRNISLYATVAAAVAVAGALVVVFLRPGVSVGVVPPLRTAAAAAAASPAEAAAAPAQPSETAAQPDVTPPQPADAANADAGSEVAVATSAGTSASGSEAAPAAKAPAAEPANPQPAATFDSLFSQPKQVQTIPVYGDGSLIEPTEVAPSAGQSGAAPDSQPVQTGQAQPLQLPSSVSPAAADGDRAGPAPSAAKEVAAREPAAATRAPAGIAAAANYAAILASPSAESEARGMLGQLQRNYAHALAGHRLTYHRVKHDGQTVYEVRVARLDNADAEALCAELTKAGASCQVGSQ